MHYILPYPSITRSAKLYKVLNDALFDDKKVDSFRLHVVKSAFTNAARARPLDVERWVFFV